MTDCRGNVRGGGGRQGKSEGSGGTFTAAAAAAAELPAVKTKGGAGAGAWALGEEAAAALALKMELEVGVLGVGVFGRRRGTLGARVMGSPSNALGTPTLTALAAGALGLEAGGERAGNFEGVVVGRVNAAAAALALPRGVFFGVTPLRNTCTRANS